VLSLYQNQIESIEEDSFTGLLKLEYLHLGINSINEIDVDIFKDLNCI
jgi:Leucine-rich repeat (LRR) protein